MSLHKIDTSESRLGPQNFAVERSEDQPRAARGRPFIFVDSRIISGASRMRGVNGGSVRRR